ncbi:hypothetical protein FB548_2213 [Pseudoxanthomonas sp. 3HH-4]|nr:hypothetical protein FB548_2213 [Pseudoxanthomonas sp. 3HH-4]
MPIHALSSAANAPAEYVPQRAYVATRAIHDIHGPDNNPRYSEANSPRSSPYLSAHSHSRGGKQKPKQQCIHVRGGILLRNELG